jgi:hypothetical protein
MYEVVSRYDPITLYFYLSFLKHQTEVDMAPYIWTSALDGGERSLSHHGHFSTWERNPYKIWIGGWVVLRPSLNDLQKGIISCPCWELNPDFQVAHLATMLTEICQVSGIISESYFGKYSNGLILYRTGIGLDWMMKTTRNLSFRGPHTAAEKSYGLPCYDVFIRIFLPTF